MEKRLQIKRRQKASLLAPLAMTAGKSRHGAGRAVSVSPLAAYLREIGQTPLLTAPEERTLAFKIRRGDKKARQLMMKANLRLVVNVAKQYSPNNEPETLLDLIQEGNIGLMRAVDRFKPEFKTRFSTYGVYWIRQAILRALKSRRLVRLPENVVDRMLAMQRTRQRLYQILGRDPSPEELASEMKTSVKEIDRLEDASADVISLEAVVRGSEDDGETQLQDLLQDTEGESPYEMASADMMRRQVQSAVSTLPPRERRIIDARFGLSGTQPRTLEQIGEDFGISRERVRQLQNVALTRLRRRHTIQHTR